MIYVSIFCTGIAVGIAVTLAISKHEATQAWRWNMERPDIPLSRHKP